VVIAHRRTTLEACDRIVLLNEGRIEADGPTEEVLRLMDALQVDLDSPPTT
jgi:ABC-type bacteriocin/lantibiotic exporter with double-glycine peptidase domain